MALWIKVLQTCGLIFYLIFQVQGSVNLTSDPALQHLKVVNITCDMKNCKYLLNVSGSEFLGHYSWRLTSEEGAKGEKCKVFCPNYEIKEIETSQSISKLEVSVPFADGKIYFCLHQSPKNSQFGGESLHQGVYNFLEPRNDFLKLRKILPNTDKPKPDSSQDQETNPQVQQTLKDITNENNVKENIKNDVQEARADWADLSHDTDVNYLTSVPRPTREEKNDIEVLYHHRYIPLNDMIKQIKAKSKLDDVFNDKQTDIDANSIKTKDVRENIHDIYSINIPLNGKSNTNDAVTKHEKTKDILDEKLEAIALKLQSSKCEKIIADINKIIDELNSLPNYTTVREILVRVFPDYMSIQKNLADQYVQEIIVKSFNEMSLQNLANINENVVPNSLEDISYQNILEDTNAFPVQKDILEVILANRYDLLQEFLMKNPQDAKLEIDISENVPKIRQPRQTNLEKYILESVPDNPSLTRPIGDYEANFPNIRNRRDAMTEVDFTSVKGDSRVVVEGIRIEDSDKEPKILEGGIPSVLAESAVTLRVYGYGLTPNTVIAFTHDTQPFGQPCKFLVKGEYMIKEGSLQPRTALFDIRMPAPITQSKLYICAKNLKPGISDPILDEEKYIHQGTETWKMIASHKKLLPLWVSISLILFCLMFSALFSGLNLGLMSLDRTELKIISNTGTEEERKYARAIMPVRDHGNYLLCSILLGNVAVNSTFTIMLDELTSGLFAVIFSTLAIVMLGEITPQAICSRHGLMVGAKSIMVTKAVMALTAPLSFPVSKLLDYFLGEEIGNVYNRERLKELVKVTTDVNDLDKDEVNIISGALEMRKKTVKDVMTKLEDVFMLPISSVLDFETMSEIVKSGYSRIPVYESGRGNIVTVLFIKDLAFVDPDDNTPLRTLCQYYQNAAHFVFEDVTLDVMFKQFKDGHKGHMAFVHRINNEGEGDPFYETIGLVTLEDVIEEMIQSEIVDETDVFLDNRSKRRRRPQNKLQDFAAFAERHENQRIHISPQLTLATFQFLSTSVDAFRPDTVSETVLRRLLRQDVIQYIKIKGKTKKDPTTFVFQQGKPVDYFLLILEGRVEVTVGRENLVFEAGPFTYFGVQALTQNIGVAESPSPSAMGSLQNINMDAMLRHSFVPDYSVRAITSLYYLTVKRSLYLAAKRATLMEKGNISKGGTTQEFDTEVDKLLESVDEDLSITGEHKTPSRQVSPHPLPVPPSPRALERNGHAYAPTSSDEQERLLK